MKKKYSSDSFFARQKDRHDAYKQLAEATLDVLEKFDFDHRDCLTTFCMYIASVCHVLANVYKRDPVDTLKQVAGALLLQCDLHEKDIIEELEAPTYLIVYRWDENQPFLADVYGLVSIKEAINIENRYLKEGGFDYIDAVRYNADGFSRQMELIDKAGANFTVHYNEEDYSHG